jgi:hypothetical protein
MVEWEIKKTLGQCAGTEQEFAVGQEYFAALVAIDKGFERRDFSVDYWLENKPEVYCFWKTKMVDPAHKKKLFIDDEMLMSFFERLGEETDKEKVNFRFVLTLVLMRKRKLKYLSDAIRDGREIWHMRVAGQGREVTVVNPHLSEDQIEELSEHMGQIMQVDI